MVYHKNYNLLYMVRMEVSIIFLLWSMTLMALLYQKNLSLFHFMMFTLPKEFSVLLMANAYL
ncbi:MAG: hypothetical protein EBT70_06835 [Betaproteobacteria bacterium]|nr:hypothetical protein [Betaproteobacteria bacterium]